MNILITGAAGSLGSEFTKQLLDRGDSVVAVDNSEWALVAMDDYANLTKKLGDFRRCTGEYDLIIHCAAYKHIDLIESNKLEASDNNVTATAELYQGVKGKILFISTDKAVDPSSHYGHTKLWGEELTREKGGVIARLGNIMASSGSVLPKWEACISEGKPLPVTDMAMGRYMISATEAVTKVLALLPNAKKGDVLIPEMGAEISMSDLIERVLQAHSLTSVGEQAYPIETIGIRPGEKLHEALYWDDEETVYQDLNGLIKRR